MRENAGFAPWDCKNIDLKENNLCSVKERLWRKYKVEAKFVYTRRNIPMSLKGQKDIVVKKMCMIIRTKR